MKKYFTVMKPDYLVCSVTRIPWSIIEPHREQALNNHAQSLEKLNQRGGLDPKELYAVLNDKRWIQIEDKTMTFCIRWIESIFGGEDDST